MRAVLERTLQYAEQLNAGNIPKFPEHGQQ